MNDLMNLPSLILERLEENELILVRGGEDPDDKAPNNGDGSCSGTNNGSFFCWYQRKGLYEESNL